MHGFLFFLVCPFHVSLLSIVIPIYMYIFIELDFDKRSLLNISGGHSFWYRVNFTRIDLVSFSLILHLLVLEEFKLKRA